jgi:Protein of unknown function (DUF1501)
VLRIGQLKSGTGSRCSRRELIRAGALSAFGLSLGDVLRAQTIRATPAKSVILLWLWGGPSHLDTFDLKPNAGVEYRGPYSPVSTSTPGVSICELLPSLAERANKYSIIRSLHCDSNDHGIAGTIGLTGSQTGAISLGGQTIAGNLQPTHGSVVSRIDGFSPGIPRFLTLGGDLHQGHKHITGEGGGILGPLHDPFRLDYDPQEGVKIPHLDLIDGLTPSGIDSREHLLTQMDLLSRRIDRSPRMQRLDQFYQQAFSLLTDTKAKEVFDLDREPESTRRQYGKFRFGQCCLLGRRLIEAGARFVQVNWSSHVEPIEDTGDGGWDMHDRNFQQFQDRHAWMLDQSVSALLDDLESRGMLSETVVVAIGEFGRTPKINNKSGRDHWNQCYSGLVAGGGIQPGRVIGSSDERGEHPISNPVTPADLFTTVLRQLGISSPELTGVGLLPLGKPIEELL